MEEVRPEVTAEEALPLLLNENDFVARSGGKFQENDPRLEPLLKGVSAAIRRMCGWHVSPAMRDERVLDFEGGPILVLPTLRLIEVESLTVHGHEFDVDKLGVSRNGEIALNRHMGAAPLGSGFGAVRVEMVHGFHPHEAPELAQIVQQVVSNALASPLGATVERSANLSVTWAQTAPGVSGGISLLERDMAMIRQYALGRSA